MIVTDKILSKHLITLEHFHKKLIMICLLCLMQGVQVFDMSSRSRITSISKDHK